MQFSGAMLKRFSSTLIVFLVAFVLFGAALASLRFHRPTTATAAPKHFVANTPAPANRSGTGSVLGDSTGSMHFFTKSNYTSNGGAIVLNAAQKPVVSLESNEVNGTGTFKLYRVGKNELLNYLLYKRTDASQGVGSPLQKVYSLDRAGLALERTFEQQVFQTSNQNSIELDLGLGDVGIWFLEGKVNNVVVETMIVRSHLSALIHEGDNSNIFWVQDSSYNAAADANIELYNLENTITSLGQLTTNQDGLATGGVTEALDLALVAKDNDLTVVPVQLTNLNYMQSSLAGLYYTSFAQRRVGTTSFVFTDRFLYKPGDIVQYKAIIREDDDADYQITPKTVVVTLGAGSDDERIFEKTTAISDIGTVDGSIQLPKDVEAGYYSLNIKSGDSYVASSYVQVAQFRKPDASIEIVSDKMMYLPGETMTAKITGTAFLGQPLRSERIRYKVYQYEADLDGDFEQVSFIQNIDWSADQRGSIKEGEVKLDRTGTATLELPVVNTTGVRQFWTIHIQYLDASGTAATAAVQALVQPGDFIIEAKQDPRMVVDKETLFPLMLSKNFAAADVGNIEVGARLLVKSGQEYVLEQSELKATSDNHGLLSIPVTPKKNDSYRLELETHDTKGNLIKGVTSFYAAKSTDVYEQPEDIFVITTDKETYQVGDVVQISVETMPTIKTAFISIGRSYSREFRVLHLTDGKASFTVPVIEKFQPNFFIMVGSFLGDVWKRQSTDLTVNTLDKKVSVKITPSQTSFGPAETARFDITTTDGEGSPVQTDLAFWIFDKALLELHGMYFSGIFDRFWNHRWFSASTNYSYQGITSSSAEGGGGSGGDVRSAFKDTAYWNPHVMTDATGKAQVSVVLPDNLTTWVAAAVSANTKTQVGEGQAEFVVTKSVVARPILPAFLRVGDQVQLSALIQNFTANAETFAVEAAFSGGELQNTQQTTVVPAEDLEELSWPATVVSPLQPASFKVRTQGTKNTALVDETTTLLPVYDFGFRQLSVAKAEDTATLPISLAGLSDPAQTKLTLAVRSQRYPALATHLIDVLEQANVWSVDDAIQTLVVANLVSQFGPALGVDMPASQVADAVKKSVTALVSDQNEVGVWLDGNQTIDAGQSRQAVEALLLAQQAGYPVDEVALEKAIMFFSEWNPVSSNEIIEQQYVFSLLPDRQLNRKKVALVTNEEAELVARAVLANLRQGFSTQEEARVMIMAGAKETPTQLSWQSTKQGYLDRGWRSIGLPTSWSIRAMQEAGVDSSKVVKALDYVYRNTLSSYGLFAEQAIATIAYYNDTEQLDSTGRYQVFLGETLLADELLAAAREEPVEYSIDRADLTPLSSLRVEKSGVGKLYSTLLTEELITDRNSLAQSHDLTLTRSYLSTKKPGEPTLQGDLVLVQFKVEGLGRGESAVTIEDYLPSGLVAIDTSLTNDDFEQGGVSNTPTGQQLTDQGMKLSFSRLFYDQGIYTYKTRVVSEGVFDAPPATVRLTNEPSIWASTTANQLTIDGKHSLETTSLNVTNSGTDWETRRILLLLGAVVVVLAVITSAIVFLRRRRALKLPPPPDVA